MKYGKISLVLAFLLVLSMFSFAFVPSVSAYTITVDGNPVDWLSDASAQPVNTGKWYYNVPGASKPYDAEYVWKDAPGDDTGNGSYVYPTDAMFTGTHLADLLEFRITWDANNLYFLFKMANVSNVWNDPAGFCGVYIAVLVDNNFTAKNRQEFPDSEASWYKNPEITPDFQVRIRGNNTDGTWGGSCVIYPWTSYRIQAKGSNTTNCIEAAVPLSYPFVGSPSGKDWKFACGVSLCAERAHRDWQGKRDAPMEVNETAASMCPGGGGRAGTVSEWADPDLFDLAFYSTQAAQEGDLNDFNVTLGSPTWWENCAHLSYPIAQYSGEGWEDLGFRNQMGQIAIVSGAYTLCTPDMVNATEEGLEDEETFPAEIRIDNVSRLWVWAVEIAWDPRCLDLVSWTEDWTWFATPGPPYNVSGTPAIISHALGTATGAYWATLDPTPPTNGTGTIVDLVFRIKNYTGAYGVPLISTVRFTLVSLIDYDINDVIMKEHELLFTYPPPPPSGPTAIIEQSPPPYYEGEVIRFNSTSTGGWNGLWPVPLDNCTWTIKNSTGHLQDVWNGTHIVKTPVTIDCQLYPKCPINFTPPVEDIYTIILEVRTKPDAVLDRLGNGYNYDNETDTKKVIKKALIFVDCFTNKMRRCGYAAYSIGMGWNMTADAYMLDELVTLYAWVVYRNNPMQHRLVSFEVYSPLGLYMAEQNMTDSYGLAYIKFRLPTECAEHEKYFGKWRCFQKVLLCDIYYNDTIWWDVGWIVHIQKVDLIDENGVAVTDIDMDATFGVRIELKNIAMARRTVLVAIKIFDDNGVLVLYRNFTTSYPGGDFCEPAHNITTIEDLTFPKWIYPGVCTLWVSAWFNGLPSECGHCTCPPVKDVFVVTQEEPEPPDPP